ncbi:hypothetical protein [Roseomonas sp. USHLN139]|uniref:hypothetical protein n=1 Tax=Roseomonas sp. USHLN139 TaxID=3081298 RepID=UPI003B014B1F
MSRPSPYQRLLVSLAADASFRVLPPMVRLLMHELVAFFAAAPEPGRLRFLGSVPASVSHLVSLNETEVETGLETLAALGLIEHETAANTLWLRGARAGCARAEAARINGSKGGRPRKNPLPVPGQTALMLPIQGGAVETQETEAKPGRESSRAVVLTTSRREEGSTARELAAWVALGQQVADIAGLDPARGGYDFSPVRGWLTKGASPELIVRTVQQVARRPDFATKKIRTLTYFDGAIDRAIKAPRPAVVDQAEETCARMAEDNYQALLTAWAQNPKGPRPTRAAA